MKMKKKIIISLFIGFFFAVSAYSRAVGRASYGYSSYESLIEKNYVASEDGHFRYVADFVSYYYDQFEDNTNGTQKVFKNQCIAQFSLGIPNIIAFDTEIFGDYSMGNIIPVLDNGINLKFAYTKKMSYAINYVSFSVVPIRKYLSLVRIGKQWLNYGEEFLYRSWGRDGIMLKGPRNNKYISYDLFYTLDNYTNFYDIETKQLDKNGTVLYGGQITGGWNRLEQGTLLFNKFAAYSNNAKSLDGYLVALNTDNYFWRFRLQQRYGYANRTLLKQNQSYSGFLGNIKLTANSLLFNKLAVGSRYCDKNFAIKESESGEYYAPTYISDWLENENRELALDEYGFSAMAEIETVNQFYFELWFDKSFNLSGNPDINNYTWENGMREKTHYLVGVSYYYLTILSYEIYFDYFINRYKMATGYYDGKMGEFYSAFTLNPIENLRFKFGITPLLNQDQRLNYQLTYRYFIGIKYQYKRNFMIKAEFLYRNPNTLPPWLEPPLWYEGPYWNFDVDYDGFTGLDNYFRIFMKISI